MPRSTTSCRQWWTQRPALSWSAANSNVLSTPNSVTDNVTRWYTEDVRTPRMTRRSTLRLHPRKRR
jgi:hypothetical protein